jgi:hypothetical protein
MTGSRSLIEFLFDEKQRKFQMFKYQFWQGISIGNFECSVFYDCAWLVNPSEVHLKCRPAKGIHPSLDDLVAILPDTVMQLTCLSIFALSGLCPIELDC